MSLGDAVQETIAERRLLFAPKGRSERRELVIRIGRPYWVNDDVAACPLSWDGLFEDMPDIQGADLLQALHLAADVESMLRKLSQKYDFYFPTGEPYFDSDESSSGST